MKLNFLSLKQTRHGFSKTAGARECSSDFDEKGDWFGLGMSWVFTGKVHFLGYLKVDQKVTNGPCGSYGVFGKGFCLMFLRGLGLALRISLQNSIRFQTYYLWKTHKNMAQITFQF